MEVDDEAAKERYEVGGIAQEIAAQAQNVASGYPGVAFASAEVVDEEEVH